MSGTAQRQAGRSGSIEIGADPPIIARTPLRLSLGGGGTDLPFYSGRHGGDLLTVAISRYVTVIAQRSGVDGLFRFSHETTVTSRTPDELDAPFARSALALLGMATPCEIASLGAVPAGTGLGSSGAFSVSLLAALTALTGRSKSRAELAELGWELEARLLNRPIGKQDQYACALGGLRRLTIDRSGRALSTAANVSPPVARALDDHLLLFYTGVRRDSAGLLVPPISTSGLAERIAELHEIRKIGQEIRTALEAGDVASVGALLHEHWLVKRTREKTTLFDDCYTAARRCGATGGKLVGAGWGGFLLLFAPPEHQPAVTETLSRTGLTPMPFTFDMHGTAIARAGDAWEPLT